MEITRKSHHVAAYLFCFALLSIFLPLKIYPFVFLLASVVFFTAAYRSSATTFQKFAQEPWLLALCVFVIYAIFSFAITSDGEPPIRDNLIKLVINMSFFATSIYWLAQQEKSTLIRLVDWTMHLILVLCFLQLLIYHQAFHFQLITGASSSAKGSALYNKDLFFWGLSDKNMFGARIALLGLIYILIPLIRDARISCWRILFVFLLAFLSLSRTPIVALLIGVLLIFWFFAKRPIKIALVLFLCFIAPFIFEKVLRVDTLTASNDGMGVRITYWKAFFQHFEEIKPWGNGFLKGGDFLAQYAAYYHGEPHIHNTFLSCYLELGMVGLLSYVLFLWFFFRYCKGINHSRSFWLAVFLPLLAIMMILYSGYDNDIILYLQLSFILGTSKKTTSEQIKIGF
ncbi:O-antigen ligase [Olivibacter sp. XZL3]|uniref:O-antigen ligase family protein n=1 Tax=Olivibacter sp. XZL3 TaxID=1735116 RepID=UPI0010653A2A|nr:O-antigen ligase family protein [Olivibacter sp. XZL3]